jgi:NADPH2:quinone reductase
VPVPLQRQTATHAHQGEEDHARIRADGVRAAPALADLDLPEPAEGEVRVRVHAASVNGFDLSVARSVLEGMMEHRFPVVLGKDFAGVVDAVGPGVSNYQVRDRVFGVVTKPYLGDGSFAEYVTVPTEVGLAKLPDGVDFVAGAALGLAGAAAVSAVDAAELKPGQSVLVVGATGGVGNQAVQLAAKAGAQVTATAVSEEEKALVSELGATATVDHSGDLVEAVRAVNPDGVDVVLHFAGDPAALLATVRPGGRFVSTIVQPQQLPTDDATVIGIYTHPDPAKLDRLAGYAADGATRVRIQDTFPLDKAPDAFATFTHGTLGKIVITIT